MVTLGYIHYMDLDQLSIDDIDDLTIVASAEADAMRRARKKRESRS